MNIWQDIVECAKDKNLNSINVATQRRRMAIIGTNNELATLRAEVTRLTAELAAAREALTKLMQWATLDRDDGYDMTIVLSIDDYRYFLAIASGAEVPE